jgi:hypothetical protein
MTGGGPTGDLDEHDDGTAVLAVERAAGTDPPAAGDDIVVIRRGPPPRPTHRRVVIAALVAIVVVAAAVVAVALTNDDDPKNSVDASAATPTSARFAETTVAARPTAAPTTVAKPLAPISVAPTTVAIAPTTRPVAPPPTTSPANGLGPVAALSVTIEPANASVSAGTPVVVTLRAHNGGTEAASVPYDNDGCDPALVPPTDTVCTMATRQLTVAAGADASTTITISTDSAAPGDYDVAIGDRTVRVTIV